MPETYDLKNIKLPEDSEFHALTAQCPDIAAIRFADGEYLIREGEDCLDIFLVLRGSFVVEQAGAGPGPQAPCAVAIVTCTAEEPQFVGEMAYLGQGRRSASVRASMAVFTLKMEPKHLDVVIGRFPMLTRVLCGEFTRRLKETTEALTGFQDGIRIHAEQVFARPGQAIFEQGQPADKLYQLVDGAVVRTAQGKSATLRPDDLPQGFLDAGAYFADGKHEATVKAEGGAILVAIDRGSKLAVVRRFPKLLLDTYQAEKHRP